MAFKKTIMYLFQKTDYILSAFKKSPTCALKGIYVENKG